MPFGYNVYFSDRFNNRIFSFSPDTGEYEILVGSEGREKSPLSEPYGLAVSSSGDLLIADKANSRICRLINSQIQRIDTYDPDGHRNNCRFSDEKNFPWFPTGIFQEQRGSLLVSYADDCTIYRIEDNQLKLVLGIPPVKPYRIIFYERVSPEDIMNIPLTVPVDLVARPDNTIFFIERGWNTVREYNPQKGLRNLFPFHLQRKFGRIKKPPQQTKIEEYYSPYPMSLALSGDDILFLADSYHRCVYEIDLSSGDMTLVMVSSHKEKKGPVALALGNDKTLWLIDAGNRHLYGYQKIAGAWEKIDVEFALPESDHGVLGGMGMVTQ